ncbi:Hypothetical predicted protein, partial [Marmota monax]
RPSLLSGFLNRGEQRAAGVSWRGRPAKLLSLGQTRGAHRCSSAGPQHREALIPQDSLHLRERFSFLSTNSITY